MVLRTKEAVLLKVSFISLRSLEYMLDGPLYVRMFGNLLLSTQEGHMHGAPICFFSAAFYVHKLMFGTFYKCFMSMGF